MGRKFGYARISSDQGQDLASQRMKLEELGAMVVFSDIGNGSTLVGRDGLDSLLKLLEPGDEVISLHPDRIGRDTADLLTVGKRMLTGTNFTPLRPSASRSAMPSAMAATSVSKAQMFSGRTPRSTRALRSLVGSGPAR